MGTRAGDQLFLRAYKNFGKVVGLEVKEELDEDEPVPRQESAKPFQLSTRKRSSSHTPLENAKRARYNQ